MEGPIAAREWDGGVAVAVWASYVVLHEAAIGKRGREGNYSVGLPVRCQSVIWNAWTRRFI